MADIPEYPTELIRRLMAGMPRNTSAPMPNYATGDQFSPMPVYGSGASTAGMPNPAMGSGQAFGSMMPFSGLKNQMLPPFEVGSSSRYMPPIGSQRIAELPAFESPGGSLPFAQYFDRPPAQPTQRAQAPAAMPNYAPQAQPAPAVATMEPTPQIDAEAIRRAELEAWRRKAGQWATNFGNYSDQNA